MAGLSLDLYSRCRDTLLHCSEFDSHTALRAVFVTGELYPFRGDLPEAAAKGERVAACLDYLLEQRAAHGRPVLVTFLATLRDRYAPGNALRDDLGVLAAEVEVALSPESPLSAAGKSQQVAQPGRSDTPAPPRRLSREQKLSLTSALLQCQSMSDRHIRDLIVDDLGPDIRTAIRRHTADKVDVANIVSTCGLHPGGIEELIELVRFYEGDSLGMQAVDVVANPTG